MTISYDQCFKASLDAPAAAKITDVHRELRFNADGELELKFIVHLKVFEATWTPAYAFTLKPIAVARIAVVESKLFDLEEEVRAGKVASPSIAEFKLAGPIAMADATALNWKAAGDATGRNSVVVDDKTIRVQESGTYLIGLQLVYTTESYDAVVSVRRGDQELFKCSALCNEDEDATVCAQWVAHLKTGDELRFCGNNMAASHETKLAITRLGN